MTDGAETLRVRALHTLTTARDRTTLLTSCVEDPDLTAQHSPLMSPLVWDLAHIGNQEELWLLRNVAGREAMRPEIDGLYDAFEHPRAERPKLPLLPPDEARRYAGRCGDGSWTCWSPPRSTARGSPRRASPSGWSRSTNSSTTRRC